MKVILLLLGPLWVLACFSSSDQRSVGSACNANGECRYSSDSPQGLTLKEIIDWTRSQHSTERSILRTAGLDFGRLSVNEALPRYLKVANPSESPVYVELFLVPENVQTEELAAADGEKAEEEEFDLAGGSIAEVVEAVSRATRASPCKSRFPSDFSIISKLSSLISGPSYSLARLSWLPRILCTDHCFWTLSEADYHYDMLESGTQGFFISAEAIGVKEIPPKSNAVLGPIYFSPEAIGFFNASLLVRSSAAGLESIPLTGTGGFARLAFEHLSILRQGQLFPAPPHFASPSAELDSLPFHVSKVEITRQAWKGRLPERMEFTRVYYARNVGEIPVSVRGVAWEGVTCSMKGFTIANCGEHTIVSPSASYTVNITYSGSLHDSSLSLTLWLLTDSFSAYIPFEFSVDIHDFSLLSDSQGVNKACWRYLAAEMTLLSLTMLACGVISVAIKESLAGRRPGEVLIAKQQPFPAPLTDLYQEPVLLTIPPRPEPFTPPLIVEKPDEDVRIGSGEAGKKEEIGPALSGKPRKVRRQKMPILRFAPAVQTCKQTYSSSSPLLATPRLVSKRPDPPDESDSEKLVERSSTATSQTTEGDSEYLDDYKTRMGLFGGFNYVD